MTDTELLKEAIKNSGMTVVAIAKKAGIKRETLYNRLKDNTDFKASEIIALSKVLNLSLEEREKIFFCTK